MGGSEVFHGRVGQLVVFQKEFTNPGVTLNREKAVSEI
jgi:hypothetical protein